MTRPGWDTWALEGRPEGQVLFVHPKTITPEIERLIEASTHDRFLGDIAKHKNPRLLVLFQYEGAPAGFAIPRKDSDGRYRTGPIFVLPHFRRKGIAQAFVKDYFKDKKGRAYIEPDNRPSQALYESAGFAKSGKTLKDGEDTLLHEYLKG